MSNGLSFVGSQRAGSCIWIYKAWYFHRKRKIRQHFRKQLPGKIILESFLCLETVITELVAKAYACKWNHLTNLKNLFYISFISKKKIGSEIINLDILNNKFR